MAPERFGKAQTERYPIWNVLGPLLNINAHIWKVCFFIVDPSCLEIAMRTKLATWCCWHVSQLPQVMFEPAIQPKFASTHSKVDKWTRELARNLQRRSKNGLGDCLRTWHHNFDQKVASFSPSEMVKTWGILWRVRAPSTSGWRHTLW